MTDWCDKRSFSPVVVFSKQVFFQLGKIVDVDREKKTFLRHRRLLCRRDVFSPESVGFAAARRTTKKMTTTTTKATFCVGPVAKKRQKVFWHLDFRLLGGEPKVLIRTLSPSAECFLVCYDCRGMFSVLRAGKKLIQVHQLQGISIVCLSELCCCV